MFSKKVAAGKFVKRQTKESGFSHFNGSWEMLEGIVESSMSKPQLVRPGYKDGVILVDMEHGWQHYEFYSAIVDLTDQTKITANYAPRRIGEAPFIRLSAKAKKQRAQYISFVCYRHDVLMENDERETDAE